MRLLVYAYSKQRYETIETKEREETPARSAWNETSEKKPPMRAKRHEVVSKPRNIFRSFATKFNQIVYFIICVFEKGHYYNFLHNKKGLDMLC